MTNDQIPGSELERFGMLFGGRRVLDGGPGSRFDRRAGGRKFFSGSRRKAVLRAFLKVFSGARRCDGAARVGRFTQRSAREIPGKMRERGTITRWKGFQGAGRSATPGESGARMKVAGADESRGRGRGPQFAEAKRRQQRGHPIEGESAEKSGRTFLRTRR